MNNNNNNILLWVVIGLTVLMVGIGFGGKFLVDKVADKVIQKLQKDYSPSPYGPGIDPDKLDLDRLKKASPTKVIQPQEKNGWELDWGNPK